MTIRTPSWLQAGSYAAETDRLLIQSLLGASPNLASAGGIVAAADLAVTASGTPDMNVHVAAGAAFVPGSETSTQGVYGFYSDASVTVPIAASSGSNPRISLIVAEVLDAGYSGSSNQGQVIEVAGTPASTPVAPAVPKNAITLAQILVGTSVTSITNANITDKRIVWARPDTAANAAKVATLQTKLGAFGIGSANAGSPPAAGSPVLLMQAGAANVTSTSGAFTVNFPTAFPNGCLIVVCNGYSNTAFSQVYPQSVTASGFNGEAYSTAGAARSGTTLVNWLAIGF